MTPELLSRLVRRLRMRSLKRPPQSHLGAWVQAMEAYVDRVWASRSQQGKIGGKISVKSQFAKNIWNFCKKGECGALTMIYLNRLS